MKRTKSEVFKEKLISFSVQKSFPLCVDEWNSLNDFATAGETSCICGTRIKNIFCFRNTHTQQTIDIGICCQKKFIPEKYKQLLLNRRIKKEQQKELKGFYDLPYEREFLISYRIQFLKDLPKEIIDDGYVDIEESFYLDRIFLYDDLVLNNTEENLLENRLYRALLSLPFYKTKCKTLTNRQLADFLLSRNLVEKVS